MQSTDLNWKY